MTWFRRKSDVDPVLNAPRRLSTADYLCKLMEEQNSLLRELIARTTGNMATTRKAYPLGEKRIRTAEDVTFVGRIQSEDEKLAKGNGRGSEPTASTSGHTPNGPVDAPAASTPRPSAP